MNAGETITLNLPAGQVLTITAASGVTGSAIRMSRIPGGEDQSVTAINGANLTFGPYADTERFKIVDDVGSVTYSMAVADPAVSATDAEVTALLVLKAPIASPTFTGTVGGITKSMVGLGSVDNTTDAGKPVSTSQQTALDLKLNKAGTATNDSAAAGGIGELLTAELAVGSATSLVTATAKTIISVSLTAGDWDVNGVVNFLPAATTSLTSHSAGSSSTDNTLGADGTLVSDSVAAVVLGSVTLRDAFPTQRFSLASTTTVYLVGSATFTVSTMTAYGSIRARRVR